MPRSSFSDNPLLRVSRPVSACSRCRAAKVKCDGKLPACTACEKAGRESECSAANDQFARGKERSYVAALELRIEKLERRLAFARLRKASVARHDSEAGPMAMTESNRKDSLAKIRDAIHRKAARRREDSDVNSLMAEFGFLSVNATTRDFEPSMSSNMTFARLVLAAASNDPLPDSQNWGLPPRHTIMATIQYYMTNIYSLFPSFPESVLYAALDHVYSQKERSPRDCDFWLVYMVLAVGSMAQSQVKDDDFFKSGSHFASKAMGYADRALMPGYTSQIQSLILLTQYSMLDPAHFDSWHLIGFTCRAVIDLGYHQDPPSDQVTDKAALDLRRKTFYCVYALDRTISMSFARAFSFTHGSINVAWPRASSFARRQSITGQPHTGTEPGFLLFQLRRAQSHWYQELYQSGSVPLKDPTNFVWTMCRDMKEWGETLPSSLPTGFRAWFDLELHYSFVFLLAPSERTPYMTDYSRLLIFEYSMAYLDKIYDVSHNSASGAFYTYHDALRVFFIASQFIAVLRDAEDLLLSGNPLPSPPSEYGKPPPPSLPPGAATTSGESIQRSLRCLQRTGLTLAKYGQRWENSVALKQSFDIISAEVVERLGVRQSLKQQASPPQSVSPPAREMRWVGVDMESIMKGSTGGNGARGTRFD
ncbi:fungal-specific transcription factor domain-containing protein [Microdochium trichocladiopsis]|uniref:Fungal-specific transcription factor domain-containing protein n=1 Tax=Microdochium trichocladiopsis TaxID=1682393 RepID=A0A9P8XZ54_9PEZI|nr:fungal-specific transcription factor domain-containing protein [Microdochium trichocladiopsis]KAH7026385.1 fungal-specific transcription factor domain-containing protein [Microdochium trichocladiopsis]